MLKLYNNDITKYLESSEIIDFYNKEIKELGNSIADKSNGKTDYIKNAYEYVRDQIRHSADYNQDLITWKASDVLREKHGICFAKSHLLAALLRYQSIPCGFCYQKLILDDETAPVLILHGLNGVYIDEYSKWIRLDPRGNRSDVNAQFSLDKEILAFPIRKEKGEEDILVIYPEPDPNVIRSLKESKTRTELWNHLPNQLAR